MEKDAAKASIDGFRDQENSALIEGNQGAKAEEMFRKALDKELDRIVTFYETKEHELIEELDNVTAEEKDYEEQLNLRDASHYRTRQRSGSAGQPLYGDAQEYAPDDSEHEGEEPVPHPRRSSVKPFRDRRNSLAWSVDEEEQAQNYADQAIFDFRITLKKRLIGLYVSLCELRSYVSLNYTGFEKAIKKFDKVLGRKLRPVYMKERIETSYPWLSETRQHSSKSISQVEQIYSRIVTESDLKQAKQELQLHVREQVVWARNTVWRDMISIERRTQAAQMGISKPLLSGQPHSSSATDEDNVIQLPFGANIPKIRYIPRWVFSANFLSLIVITLIFIILLNTNTYDKVEERRCFAMVVLVSLLWATETIPLFVTSLLVPFLVVVLGILRTEEKPYRRLTALEASSYIFSAMWTSVIMLLLGGFAIAAALSKYHIAKHLATWVLSKAGPVPRNLLLVTMFVATFLSMWISNVAAPVLCYSIIQPVLRTIPVDSAFGKSLVIGVALASNIGGMASPISSPQNIIALQSMNPSPTWGQWLFISIPVCICADLLIWLLLLVVYKSSKFTIIAPIRATKDSFSGVQYFISFVTVVTIILWCLANSLKGIFGDMGVIAIIPLVVFFGTGILNKEDFNNFLWTVIILAMGGIALGKAVTSSGLLHAVAGSIKNSTEGVGLFGTWVIFGSLTICVTTFISHTVSTQCFECKLKSQVGALIIIPIVAQVGASMRDPHPNLLIMGTAMMCSAAMALPMSG